MAQNIIKSNTKAPLLNVEHTQQFVNEMDVLLKKFDFNGMVRLSKNYPFNAINQKELDDFIERAESEHINWYENPLEIKINTIEAFTTKCIACQFGKTVKAYRVVFNEMKAKILPGRINYGRSLAMYFDIKNNELFDFGWCNAFLEKNEMDLLKDKKNE
jgi:hypothetical protein